MEKSIEQFERFQWAQLFIRWDSWAFLSLATYFIAPKTKPNNEIDQLAEYLAQLESDKVNDLLDEVKVQENPAFDASDYV